jgi:hypothetical protein
MVVIQHVNRVAKSKERGIILKYCLIFVLAIGCFAVLEVLTKEAILGLGFPLISFLIQC